MNGTTGPGRPPGRAATAGLWLLPLYGLLLALSTVTQQPDRIADFPGYARYVTTDVFLVSHLVASIGGAALAILGTTAAVAHLAQGRARRPALAGLVLTVVANVYGAAAFGSAAFVQPGIGRAFLRGIPGMEQLNEDTAYGPALVATIAGMLLLLVAGAVVLGTAISRTAPTLRWVGVGYALGLCVFSLSGVAGLGAGVQPAAGVLLAAATAVLARRLPAVAHQGAPLPSQCRLQPSGTARTS